MRTREQILAALESEPGSWPIAPAGIYQTGVGTKGTTMTPMAGDPIWAAIMRDWVDRMESVVPVDVADRHRVAELLKLAHDAWRLGVVRCLEHSGVGASIAMETLTTWLWLAGVVNLEPFDAMDWGAYGAPRFDAIAAELHWSQFAVVDQVNAYAFDRQARRLGCRVDCPRCPRG